MKNSTSLNLPDKFNVATYFIDNHEQEGRGNKVAIECENIRLTYTELRKNVNRFGNLLLNLKLNKGSRVLILLHDIPEFPISFFGAIKIGVIPVPVNTLLKSNEYEYLLNDSEASVMVVSYNLLPEIQKIPKKKLHFLKHILVVGTKMTPNSGFNNGLKKNSSELSSVSTHKNDVAFWLYSSGSTGPPKACVHLQHDMVVCSERYAKGILHMNEQDRCFSVSKLFFAYGLGNALYFPLSVGATSILSPTSPKPQSIFKKIELSKPTIFFSVPSNYALLLAYQSEAHKKFDLSSIRLCISAGETLPPKIFHDFKRNFKKEILDGIGSTEALQTFISNIPGDVRPGSSGKIIPGYKAKILKENAKSVKIDEIGDLYIKTEAACAYYWKQPEKSKDIDGDWIKTGDKYQIDKDGFFWNAGRTDDMIKSSGAWVSPIEVENVLLEHPAVFEAAVVGKKNKIGFSKPKAFIVLKKNIVASSKIKDDIKKFSNERLPNYKRLYWIDFLQQLPKTTTGKIQRFKLR